MSERPRRKSTYVHNARKATFRTCIGLGCKPGEGFFSTELPAYDKKCPKCRAKEKSQGKAARSSTNRPNGNGSGVI